jgi:hypothetical protein
MTYYGGVMVEEEASREREIRYENKFIFAARLFFPLNLPELVILKASTYDIFRSPRIF